MLVLAPTGLAQSGPWPVDGRNVFSFRNSTDVPGNITGLSQAWRRDFDSDVTGTPIVADTGAVYFGTWAGEVYALVWSTGQTAWARGASNVGGPVVGSTLYANNTVYAVASAVGSPRLVALDPVTGAHKWSTVVDNQGDSDSWAAPTYSAEQNLVYVSVCACKAMRDRKSGVTTRGAVVAIDATTGAVVWKTHMVPPGSTGGVISGTPIVFDFNDRVYVTTNHAFQAPAHPNTNAIVAMNTATGAIEASYQAIPGDVGTTTTDPTKMVGFQAGPIGFRDADGGHVRVGAGAKNGHFYAVDYDTLALAWDTTVTAGHQLGGIQGAYAWNVKNGSQSKLLGTASTPSIFWGIHADNSGGTLDFAMPNNDVVHSGPATTTHDNVIWTTDTSGFLDLNSGSREGLLITRYPLGAPSTGGVSFGFRRAFVAVGTGQDTGGALISYR